MPAIAYLGVRYDDRVVVLAIDDFARRGRVLARCYGFTENTAEFDWGNTGRGAAQLALAILADHLGDPPAAFELHQRFHFAMVTNLLRPAWALRACDIEAALARLAA